MCAPFVGALVSLPEPRVVDELAGESRLTHRAFEDGVISDAEFDDAVGAWQTCLRDEGLAGDWDGQSFGFSARGAPGESETGLDARTERVEKSCRAQHLRAVEAAYSQQQFGAKR